MIAHLFKDKHKVAGDINPLNLLVYFISGGQRVHKTLKVGHHRPGSKRPCKWRLASGPMIA